MGLKMETHGHWEGLVTTRDIWDFKMEVYGH